MPGQDSTRQGSQKNLGGCPPHLVETLCLIDVLGVSEGGTGPGGPSRPSFIGHVGDWLL